MLQDCVNNAKIAMDELQQNANEYGIPRDKYDSFKAQVLQKKDLFAVQYQRALDDINLLEKINLEKKSEKVEFGSIIITNKQKMIISASLGNVLLENNTYFAISPQVPIFKQIQGLKKGDKFTFSESEFEVLNIF